MSDHPDADLQALFARPAALDDSQAALNSILAEVDRQQSRRRIWLAIAALAGLSLPIGLLAAAVGWPLIATRIADALMALEGVRGSVRWPQELLAASAPYGVWIAATLGIIATAVAALRSINPR